MLSWKLFYHTEQLKLAERRQNRLGRAPLAEPDQLIDMDRAVHPNQREQVLSER